MVNQVAKFVSSEITRVVTRITKPLKPLQGIYLATA